MDRVFERFHKMMEDMVFSGFFDREFTTWHSFPLLPGLDAPVTDSPRDEMLREPEGESRELPDPEPWTPFPFYGDLVKPDMMDREFFTETQRRRHMPSQPKKDIILDEGAPVDDLLAPGPSTQVHRWSQSFSRRMTIGPDGKVIESETRVVQEPDGTKVRTTVERSPQGERKRIVRQKPSGEEEVEEVDTNFVSPNMIMPPSSPPDQSSQPTTDGKSSGIFDKIRRWFQGSDQK
ncbi:hypothetical protein T265_00713 [Opisthorchis viverrini]|uniref:Uncharacterized protein n=2 Tax=Opisthorchis viverrini TaxID=6198 RepID=A0A075A0Z4_OPIVI|nr:hypothetical protein T265_00713 [Opisthorchis viverrini]KER33398.1 hypothetical protein T265_00713 [Opisthorchis viverrini]